MPALTDLPIDHTAIILKATESFATIRSHILWCCHFYHAWLAHRQSISNALLPRCVLGLSEAQKYGDLHSTGTTTTNIPRQPHRADSQALAHRRSDQPDVQPVGRKPSYRLPKANAIPRKGRNGTSAPRPIQGLRIALLGE